MTTCEIGHAGEARTGGVGEEVETDMTAGGGGQTAMTTGEGGQTEMHQGTRQQADTKMAATQTSGATQTGGRGKKMAPTQIGS